MTRTMNALWMVLAISWAGVAGAQQVTLAWDASSCCAAGYRLYYGTNAGSYRFVTNAGPALRQTVMLPHGGRWFFAVRAYSENGLESDFGKEVSWESGPPAADGRSWVRVTPILERSTNMVTWASVTGAPVLFPATNRAEFFRACGVVIERVQRAEKP